MAGPNLCVTCAALPRKDKSLAVKSMRCVECKTTFGVTSYGSAFRFSPVSHGNLFSKGFMAGVTVVSALFTMLLTLVGMGLWSTDTALPKRRAAEPQLPRALQVKEVAVADPIPQNNPVAAKQTIAQLAKRIKDINSPQHPDAFVVAHMKDRKELQGMPFVMGKDCRLGNDRARNFEGSVQAVRDSLEQDFHRGHSSDGKEGDAFWNHYQQRTGFNGTQTPHGVAALTQMLGPERTDLRMSLVRKLAESKTPDATRALARSAIFDVNGEIRTAALAELKKRPNDHTYDDILMHGIRYPMPDVAHRAAFAIAKLERKDLMPQLAEFLDQPAPGDPQNRRIENGQEVCEVREVVRINHHRNCLLCHPPSTTGQPNEVPGVIPIPGTPFAPSPREAYGNAQSLGDPMIRADTTYLRQDFSVMMPVASPGAWPEMQRFDFLVRNRVVEGKELQVLVEKVKSRPADFLSENHKAALDTLRRLTGQNAAANAAAWQNAFLKGRD